MWQVNPYDPNSILACQYANLVTGHYHMRRQYRIVRPAGTHDWLIKLTLSGRGLIRHGEGRFVLKPGQMAVFKPEMPHDYGTDPHVGHWEMLWVHFHPLRHWLPLLDWPEPVRGLLLLNLPKGAAEGRRVIELFQEMHRLATSNSPRRDWLAMNALEGVLLRCDALVSRAKTDLDARLESVTEYIHRHLEEALTLDDLARVAHLSVSQLSALFRTQLRVSPQQYIEGRRMEFAMRLLQFPNLSIKEVATRSGYNDPLYFSKRFRRHAQMTPTEYRAQAGAQQGE